VAGYTELGAALLTTSGVFVALTLGITQITPFIHSRLSKSVKTAKNNFGKFIADGGFEATYRGHIPEGLRGDQEHESDGVRAYHSKLMFVLVIYSALYFVLGISCIFAEYSTSFASGFVDDFVLLSNGFHQTKILSNAFIIINVLLFFVLYKIGLHYYQSIKDEIHLEYVEWSGKLVLFLAKEMLPQEKAEQNQG
jgi:hypothetical protein